jgi:3-hydroxyisobutyrate dehydrogenase-like beta-hydroxyacid dehydrogenase
VRRLGEVGSSAKLKLVANSMIAGVSALAAELLAAGTASGLKAEDVFWVISRVAPVLNARKAGFVEHRYEPVTFALRDALKDVRMATELYERAGAQAPLTGKVKELYERAVKTAGDLDMSAIATVYDGEPAVRG